MSTGVRAAELAGRTPAEPGRDHGDLHLSLQRGIDHRTEDDVRVLVRGFLYDARCLAHFDERQVGPARHVDDDPAGTVYGRALEQRTRNRTPRRFHRAVRSFGHATTETWLATQWDRFVDLATSIRT